MKKFLLLILFFAYSVLGFAQNTFPFFGKELSNYEVGDTLEYHSTVSNQISSYYYSHNFGFVIISKDTLSSLDSIIYSYKGLGISDTVSKVINNDSIYGNNNNFLSVELTKFDSAYWAGYDSAWIKYDTLNGNKRLEKRISNPFLYDQFLSIQNLGIVYHHYESENVSEWNYTYDLIFAHLNHYGIYGDYVEIPSVTPSIENNNSLALYPNPSQNTINISSSNLKGNYSLKIYNMLGQVVKQSEINFSSVENEDIDIHLLRAGYYELMLMNGSDLVSKRFVKE